MPLASVGTAPVSEDVTIQWQAAAEAGGPAPCLCVHWSDPMGSGLSSPSFLRGKFSERVWCWVRQVSGLLKERVTAVLLRVAWRKCDRLFGSSWHSTAAGGYEIALLECACAGNHCLHLTVSPSLIYPSLQSSSINYLAPGFAACQLYPVLHLSAFHCLPGASGAPYLPSPTHECPANDIFT